MSILRPGSREPILLEPVDERFKDVGREVVHQYLRGIDSTRNDPTLTYYIPSRTFGEWTAVTEAEADEMEALVRQNYAPFYPEFAIPEVDEATALESNARPQLKRGWLQRIANPLNFG